MKYTFIDIGTAYFSVSADIYGVDVQGMYVEPIRKYLDVLPGSSTIIKECAVISAEDGEVEFNALIPDHRVNYVSDKHLRRIVQNASKNKKALNDLCTIGEYGGSTLDMNSQLVLLSKNNDISYSKIKVKSMTLRTLFTKHDVTSIGYLKIDVEGFENVVLNQLIELLREGLTVETIRFEYNARSDMNELMGICLSMCEEFGYTWREEHFNWDDDIVMEKIYVQ